MRRYVWASSNTSTAKAGRQHVCNCLGCCVACGSCSTAPWHTAAYCELLVRQAAERSLMVEGQEA